MATVLACDAPARESNGVMVVRCRRDGADGAAVWTTGPRGEEVRCGAVERGSSLLGGETPHCGTVGTELWLWRQLEQPGRGSLRYRSWARKGAWYLVTSSIVPDRVAFDGQVVTQARWSGLGAPTSFERFRNRSWLGGAVDASSDGSVTVVAEPGVSGYGETVLSTLRALQQRGWGLGVSEVAILEASRLDYGSGRSPPGAIVLEVGRSLKSTRVAELVQHEVAHQLVGGSLRLVRGGEDVGWFLEGFAEYLGFAILRGEPDGRASLLRRFAEACGAVDDADTALSDYDLGFLYAAGVDGALWRNSGGSLAERLRSLVAAEGRTTVFGDRTDFRGVDERRDFSEALLEGLLPAEQATFAGWFERGVRPDVRVLAQSLGLTLTVERLAWAGLPLGLRERRDGLFEVTAVSGDSAPRDLRIRVGDVAWPLEPWSGPSLGGQVAVEVSRPSGWQRVTLATVRGWRSRWRIASADGVEARWFGMKRSEEP